MGANNRNKNKSRSVGLALTILAILLAGYSFQVVTSINARYQVEDSRVRVKTIKEDNEKLIIKIDNRRISSRVRSLAENIGMVPIKAVKHLKGAPGDLVLK